jgi:hypothetical protein
VKGADALVTQGAHEEQNEGEGKEHRVIGACVDHESEDSVAHATNEDHVGVVEQRPHKLDVDIRRDVLVVRFAHYRRPKNIRL